MAPQFIYVMKDLRKVVPPSREILRGIYLSFYPGAKIGVLGANGAGKSSLLRIMAGVDQDFQGEAWPANGTRIGYLPQEPQLDATKDVKGNVELAVTKKRALLQKFEAISMKFAEPMSDDADDEAARGSGEGAGADRCAESVGARPQHRDRDGRVAAAATGCGCEHVVGRREATRGAVPGAARPARHAAARRADQPSRRRERRVARAVSRGVSGNGGGHHARPLLPRQRREVDSRARSRRGNSVRGKLQRMARAEARASRAGREERVRAPALAAARARVGAARAARAPGEEQGAHSEVRGARGVRHIREGVAERDHHSATTATRQRCRDREERAQELRRQAALREPDVLAAARWDRRCDRTERCRQDDDVPDDHRRREAGLGNDGRSATRCRSRTSIRGAS